MPKKKKKKKARRVKQEDIDLNELIGESQDNARDEKDENVHDDDDGIPRPGRAKKKMKFSPQEYERLLERELRRYVRRGGGFRKNLPKDHKAVAKRLMKKLDRKEPEWDETILLNGIDNPTVANMIIA